MNTHDQRWSATHQRIPRARTQADAVVADAQAAHTVVVADQRANLLAAGNVPNLEMRH